VCRRWARETQGEGTWSHCLTPPQRGAYQNVCEVKHNGGQVRHCLANHREHGSRLGELPALRQDYAQAVGGVRIAVAQLHHALVRRERGAVQALPLLVVGGVALNVREVAQTQRRVGVEGHARLRRQHDTTRHRTTRQDTTRHDRRSE
jgi:hypothetical protein